MAKATRALLLRLVVLIVCVVGSGRGLCIIELIGGAQFKHRARLSHSFTHCVQTVARTLSIDAAVLLECMSLILLLLRSVVKHGGV